MFLILFNLFFTQSLWAQKVEFTNSVVGVAAGEVFTTRDVTADVIFTALYLTVSGPNYELPLKGRGLQAATSNLLMEHLIFKEAEAFRLAQISPEEVRSSINRFKQNLRATTRAIRSLWQSLGIEDSELEAIATRKLRSTMFLEQKTKTFITQVSDFEVERALVDSGKSPKLVNEKQRAEVYNRLREDKLDSAVKEWFQVLRSKYEVRNILFQSL